MMLLVTHALAFACGGAFTLILAVVIGGAFPACVLSDPKSREGLDR